MNTFTFGLCAQVLVALVGAQNFLLRQGLLLHNECKEKVCPVDCLLKIGDDGCGHCKCTQGGRCPVVNCPDNPTNRRLECHLMQQMNGCVTCVCVGPLYVIKDRRNNVETFFYNRAVRGAHEACSLHDLPRVESCTRPLHEFLDHGRNPRANHKLLPWLSFDTLREFLAVCETLEVLPSCVGPNRFRRCRTSHPKLQYFYDVYTHPCDHIRGQMEQHWTCVKNIFDGHTVARQCLDNYLRDVSVASRSQETLSNKYHRKCLSLEMFVNCIKPILADHCEQGASRVFEEVVVHAMSYLAPECELSRAGRLRARSILSQGVSQVSSSEQLPIVDLNSMQINDDLLPVSIHLPQKCEKQQERISCPNGARSRKVQRWYRPPNATRCETYLHDYCDGERVVTIEYEDECLDDCFAFNDLPIVGAIRR